MKKFIYSILLFLLFSCGQEVENSPKEERIFNRIEYVYNLRKVINDTVWHGVSQQKFDLPLIYYTDTACYITNPTKKIIDLFQAELLFTKDAIKIYKTNLVDNAPFHMETAINFGSDTSLYNFQSPVMNCSSVEITSRTIPDVYSTEMWSTMVLHEYFHGFQFKHPTYQKHINSIISNFTQDSLRTIYQSNIWFQESVDNENRLLLNAISSNDSEETDQLIDSALSMRDDRRQALINQSSMDISEVESIYETMEGSARYVEFHLYQLFANGSMNSSMIKSDTLFQRYTYFGNFKLENEEWLYLTDKTTYYYATGFNIIRLLDKLNIEYKTRLFQEEQLTLEDILKEYHSEKQHTQIR